MNKLRKVILIILIYIGLIFININVFAFTGTTIESTTRLRKEASTESAIVTLIPENAKVEIISKDGEWYKVTYTENSKKLTGFIRQDMLKAEGDVEAEAVVNNDNTIEETNNSETNTAETEKEEGLIKEGDSYNIKNNITVRILPSINSTLLEEAGANSQIKVVEIINKWCKIETETTSGWVLLSKIEKVDTNTVVEEHIEEVKEEKIEENKEEVKEEVKEEQKDETKTETKTKTLYVNTDTVNMREKPDTNSKILRQLSLNTTVEAIEQVDSTWTKVLKSGVNGYIASKYLSETKTEVTSRAMQESRTVDGTEANNTNKDTKTTELTENASKVETPNTKATTKGEEIVNFAKQYLGYKYVAGGASPSNGFDCSGFTSYVYKNFGYSLSRTSSGQLSNGKEVSSKSDLQLGDIVCFKGHVGIYVGENQFIHAANPKKGVVITSLSDSYYTANYITSRRIIN